MASEAGCPHFGDRQPQPLRELAKEQWTGHHIPTLDRPDAAARSEVTLKQTARASDLPEVWKRCETHPYIVNLPGDICQPSCERLHRMLIPPTQQQLDEVECGGETG